MAIGVEHEAEDNLASVVDLAEPVTVGDPLADAVDRVIDQCLLSMVFQPIVDLKKGTIFAYEALSRSRVPEFEDPPALVEAATAAGRVGELGRLQRALASKNCPDWPIFVNISPNEFDEGFLVRPDDAIFRHRKPVYVEITESVPLVFFEQCHSVLAELRRKGARLAIDDLGAGYSNLKYIADLAPDIVKLDRELVAGCALQGSQYELLCSIASLCHQVEARVVAEGVETAEELEAVSAAGIDLGQGFFLGRPKISPAELSWPASDLITSADFKVRRATHAADRCDPSPERADRRLDELEEIRSLLEKSVRKARGEVVRLRKAVSEAESRSERAQARLEQLESSLAESETNRRRLARLYEAATLKKKAQPAPPSAPRRGFDLKKVVAQGLIWAAGLAAGLMLYKFDPRTDRLAPPAEAGTAPVAAEAEDERTRSEIRSLVLDWARSRSGQPGEAVRDLEIDLLSDSAARASFVLTDATGDRPGQRRQSLDLVRDAGGWRVDRQSLPGA